jgi:hypothetical protein
LADAARAAGYSQAEIDADGVTWDDVYNMAKNPKEKPTTAKGKPKTAVKWAPGKTCQYKDDQYEILTVDDAKKTATLKNLTTDKTVMGANRRPLSVPFAELK